MKARLRVDAAVLGIDPSLAHTGVCLLEPADDLPRCSAHVIQTWASEAPREERLVQIRNAVLGTLTDYTIAVVALESEIWTRGHQAHDQAAVQAVIRLALWEARPRPPVLLVNPAQVKKYAGAKLKDELLLQVYKRWGVEFRDHNLADAYVLARIGQAWLQGSAPAEAPKAQHEVIKKLQKGGLLWDGRIA